MIERNVELEPKDFFRFFRNLQRTGILDKPIRTQKDSFEYVPGRRFFENIKENMLTWDMEDLAAKLESVSPIIKELTVEDNWKPVELDTKDFFRAFRNVQRAGIIDKFYYEDNFVYEPGRRFFENIKEFLNTCDMAVLAEDVEKLSPVIKLMANEDNWIM